MNTKRIALAASTGLLAGLTTLSAPAFAREGDAASPNGDKESCGGKDGCGSKKDTKDEKKKKS